MAPSLQFLSSTTSPSLCILSPHPSSHIYRSSLRFKISSSSSSQETIHVDTQQINPTTNNKKRRKPRPSFSDQIRDKWCLKPTSVRKKFPWEEQQEQTQKRVQQPIVEEQEDVILTESRIGSDSLVSDSLSFGVGNRIKIAPWVQERKPRKHEDGNLSQSHSEWGDNSDNAGGNDAIQVGYLEKKVNFPVKNDENELFDEKVSKIEGGKIQDFKKISGESDSAKLPWRKDKVLSGRKRLEIDEGKIQKFEGFMNEFHLTKQPWERGSKIDGAKLMINEGSRDNFDSNNQTWDRGNVLFNEKGSKIGGRNTQHFEGSSDGIDSTKLPWKRELDVKDLEGEDGFKKSNTMLAEKLIPEPELKRLRNVALRMVERIQVKAAGITQALVDSIHEKWKIDEVVKLKFEGSFAMNMKRTHEFLEVSIALVWLFNFRSYLLSMVMVCNIVLNQDTCVSRKSIFYDWYILQM